MSDIQDNDRELANRNFWTNINNRSDYIKYEFGQSVELLEKYLPELKSNYVELSPAFGAGELKNGIIRIVNHPNDWENVAQKLKHSLLEVSADLVAIVNDDYGVWDKIQQWMSWAWGAIIGDFNKEPTLSQTIVAGLISIIPVADQVSDVRDLVANVLTLTNEIERENKENWINLALTAFGLIPTVGSVVKTLIKVIRHKDFADIKALAEIMETCETYLRKIGAGNQIPWKDNPIRWLQTKPWQELADKAKTSIQEYLSKLSYQFKKFGSANSVNFKDRPSLKSLDTGLDALFKRVDEIAQKINDYIDQIAKEITEKVDGLLSTPYAMAMVANGGKVTHTTYVNGKTTTNATHTQKSQKAVFKQMPQKRVGCFNRVNTDKAKTRADENIKNDYPAGSKKMSADDYLNEEMDRQLRQQQEGINSLTVAEYEAGRKAFQARKASKGSGRGDGKDQEQTRKKFEADLLNRYEREYQELGECNPECQKKARETTDKVMKTLAALHNPDQILDGNLNSKVPMDMGLTNVNSSIGSQWKNVPDDATIRPSDRERTRVGAIDEAIKAIPESERANTRMNVKLERCK
ncbi:polymorphic toxin type 15 domain-containing protein [Moraxella bovis]|uniref:Novel toxin 15 domain-containing protein n=1 Tax=Moraxella bovis TaxID=476 RepID=A0A378PSP2_MORBO|nr:polymorphic toxin type 15 domain-containing protein [Moraxella bovis]STY90973.1 Uncharacterised protein [Moraxella bovis]